MIRRLLAGALAPLAALLLSPLVLAAAGSTAGDQDAPATAPVTVPAETDPQADAEAREQRILARTEKARREAQFNQLDRDGDGYLTRAELQSEAALAAEQQQLDQDRDGRVSRTEFAAVEVAEETRTPGGN